jgi:putative membrane protein
MTHDESPLAVTAKGAVAGLAGTAALTVVMRFGPRMLTGLGLLPEEAQPHEEPTAKLAGKVAGGVLERPIGEDTKESAGQAIHWAYGAGWGALYGIVQSSLRLPHLLHGALFGGVVAGVASTLVPAMRLTPPPTEQPPAMSALQVGWHLVYGWVTALTFRLLSPGARAS